jgi:poly [ADP-ribose] polymerase
MPPTIAEQHAFLDAAKAFNFAKVKSLIQKDAAYTNAQPSGRWTALHQAAYKGDEGMVSFLLSNGADIKVTTTDGKTPEKVAIEQGHPKCGALLTAAAPAPGKKTKSAAAGGGPAPKSQKVSTKGGKVQTKFDSANSGAGGSSVKQVIKGRCAVDASCPIAADMHVLDEGGDDIFDALLNQTDISVNANKYYIIQLLESDKTPHTYYTWNRWGRVGEELNKQNALIGPTTLAEARVDFEKKFKDKQRQIKEKLNALGALHLG